MMTGNLKQMYVSIEASLAYQNETISLDSLLMISNWHTDILGCFATDPSGQANPST